MTEEGADDNCYIYKHSTTCSISAAAADVVRSHAWTRPVYWVNVIEQRPLSNWVATRYGVRHESPQLLKVTDGKVEAHWSHFAITDSLSLAGGGGRGRGRAQPRLERCDDAVGVVGRSRPGAATGGLQCRP